MMDMIKRMAAGGGRSTLPPPPTRPTPQGHENPEELKRMGWLSFAQEVGKGPVRAQAMGLRPDPDWVPPTPTAKGPTAPSLSDLVGKLGQLFVGKQQAQPANQAPISPEKTPEVRSTAPSIQPEKKVVEPTPLPTGQALISPEKTPEARPTAPSLKDVAEKKAAEATPLPPPEKPPSVLPKAEGTGGGGKEPPKPPSPPPPFVDDSKDPKKQTAEVLGTLSAGIGSLFAGIGNFVHGKEEKKDENAPGGGKGWQDTVGWGAGKAEGLGRVLQAMGMEEWAGMAFMGSAIGGLASGGKGGPSRAQAGAHIAGYAARRAGMHGVANTMEEGMTAARAFEGDPLAMLETGVTALTKIPKAFKGFTAESAAAAKSRTAAERESHSLNALAAAASPIPVVGAVAGLANDYVAQPLLKSQVEAQERSRKQWEAAQGHFKDAWMDSAGNPQQRAGEVSANVIAGAGKAYASLTGEKDGSVEKLADWSAGLVKSIDDLRGWTDNLKKANTQFSEFSGGMAQVAGMQQIRDINISRAHGDARAPSAEAVSKASYGLDKQINPIEDAWAILQNRITALGENLLTRVLESFGVGRMFKELGKAIDKYLGSGEEGTDTSDFANYIHQLGDFAWKNNPGPGGRDPMADPFGVEPKK